jgi:hypothetical protein
MCGALLVFMKPPAISNNQVRLIINLFGLILVILPAVLFSKEISNLSTFNIIPCLGVAILILFEPSKHLNFIFYNRALKWIGDRSYTIYLIHWPIIVFYKYLLDTSLGIFDIILLFSITLIISHLVYTFYETPLRYTSYRISIKSDPKLIISYLSIILVIFFVNKNVKNTEGYTWRLDDDNIKLIEAMDTPVNFHYKNWGGAGYPAEKTIPYTTKNPEKVDIVWIGDSHSGHYNYAIDSIFVKKRNIQAHISNLSCIVIPGFKSISKKCTQNPEELFESKLAILDSNPDAPFVISYFWKWRMTGASRYYDSTKSEYTKLGLDKESFEKLCNNILEIRNYVDPSRKIIILGESPTVPGSIN